jgi:hypothetical protein
MQYLTKDNPVERIDFGPIPPEIENDRRAVAEEETRRDLAKKYEQLLADAHHEMTDPNNDPAIKVGFATRRIAGITTQAALAMEAATKQSSAATEANLQLQREVRDLTADLKTLTVRLKQFTIFLLFLAVIQTFYPIIKPLFERKQPKPTINQTGDAQKPKEQHD